MAKKKNPQDATLKNVRASKERYDALKEKVRKQGFEIKVLRRDLNILMRKLK